MERNFGSYIVVGLLIGMVFGMGMGAANGNTIWGIGLGAFIGLHGLVHLLYFGQSWRLFELQPGMVWPDGSWAFSKLLGDEATRLLVSMSCVLAAGGFVIGGIGMVAGWSWWCPMIVGVAGFSTAIFIFFWSGKMQRLDNQGGIALIINSAILAAVLMP